MREKPARWCHTCGATLKVTPYVYAYDEYTGAEKLAYFYECPTKRPWYMFWRSHPRTSGEAYALEAGMIGI